MLKKFFALALMLATLIFVGNAEAGTITTTYLPLQCYVDHQVNTYNQPGASQRAGYISANVDLIQVTQIRNDGWVYGSYPGRNGRVARWFRMSDLCADTNYSNRFAYVSGAQRVFRTNGRGDTIGSVSNNEPVIVIADNGNRAQIIYRLDNGTGYKLGWIPSSAVPGGNQRGGDQPINNINHNPQGTVEQVNSPSPGVLHVRGKAYDLDNARGSIRLHVYVGGGAGSGAPSYEIRTDGSSNIFDDTRQVSRTGNQRVHIYALNDYGSGENKEIWNGVVNIKSNNTKIQQFINHAWYKNDSQWGWDCAAYANEFTNFVFGKNITEGRLFKNANEIQAGDVVYLVGSPNHFFVVLAKNDNKLTTIEGNYSKVKDRRNPKNNKYYGKTVYSSTAYTIVNGRVLRNGKESKRFSYGYHFQ